MDRPFSEMKKYTQNNSLNQQSLSNGNEYTSQRRRKNRGNINNLSTNLPNNNIPRLNQESY